MSSTRSSSSLLFSSIRTRLIVFILIMLLPVLSGIYWFVSAENQSYTDQTINSNLNIGADVFDFSRQEHTDTLLTISSALTRDWGFRNAFGAAAEMMLISDMTGAVIIDTAGQGFSQLPPRWLEIIRDAAQNADGFADSILTIADIPYQLTVIPLFLPTPVAWIFAGFPLDEEFVVRVKSSTASEVSILRYRNVAAEPDQPSEIEIVASSLGAQDALLLKNHIDLTDFDQTQRIALSSADYGTLVRSLAISSDGGEEIVAVIQRSYLENEANLSVLRDRLLVFSLLIVVVSLLAVVLLARGFTGPVLRLSHRVRRIEAGDYSPATSAELVTGSDEVAGLADSIETMAAGLAEKEKVRDLLGKVVSHEIAEELLARKIELGGEEKVVSILFADIQGFTRLCEQQSPSDTLQMLNTCLEQICHAIESQGGVVDKFTGDAVMALFGAPVSHDNVARLAVRAVLAIQQAMAEVNRQLSASAGTNAVLGLGIGLHTGLVVAGNMGSKNRMNYTVIGDGVNLAARLEGLTRFYQVANVVSTATRDALGAEAEQYIWRMLDVVRVKGKREAVEIYELVGLKNALSDSELSEIEKFNQAIEYYQARRWNKALGFLEELYSIRPATLYQIYLDRIAGFQTATPADWYGVHDFDSK